MAFEAPRKEEGVRNRNAVEWTLLQSRLPQRGSLKRNKNFLLFPRRRRHQSSAQNIITPRGAHRFSSIFSIRFYLRVAIRSAAPPHLFSSIFSLLSYLKKAPPKRDFLLFTVLFRCYWERACCKGRGHRCLQNLQTCRDNPEQYNGYRQELSLRNPRREAEICCFRRSHGKW